MSSGSVRLHVPVGMHQHDDPPDDSGRTPIPDARSETLSRPREPAQVGQLYRENGTVFYRSAPDQPAEAARVVWVRPLSNREDGPVSIMLAGKKKELAYLPSLDTLPPESQQIAREELGLGMVLPRVLSISRVKPRFGNYYFDVETDMGPRRFLLSSPENNSFRPKPDVIVVKDVSGNCYEINPSSLDPTSLTELDRVL